MDPMPNKKSAIRLSANILNYFAAFTETRFNFRTLINYRWTDNELTLDLGIFQDFQNKLLQKIKTGDSAPLTVKNNEHVLSLSGDEVLLEINKALFDKFGLEYLKSCIEQEIQKVAERDVVFTATEKGLRAIDNADLSEQEIEKRNSQTFLDGCRKYNLALRKQIELILLELQEKKINRLKDELGIEHVPASTFNSANYLKKHFDSLQAITRDNRTGEKYFDSVKNHFKETIEDIVLYDCSPVFKNTQGIIPSGQSIYSFTNCTNGMIKTPVKDTPYISWRSLWFPAIRRSWFPLTGIFC